MVAAVARGEREPLLNIGQVLDRLRTDFEDVSIPKIRFLESEGLIKPERTPSGYRKFSEHDISRLRYILRMQRDHYLPLKVIGEHLDALDRGLQPPEPEPVVPTVPKVAVGSDGLPAPESFRRTDKLRLSRKELIKVAEIDEDLLVQLEEFALITPSATGHYDTDALVTAAPGLALAVVTADCVPVLMADARAGVIGAAHAGRVGAANGVVLRTLEAMLALGAHAADISVLLGPAVSGPNYEVPQHMADDVEARLPGSRTTTERGTPALDLRAGIARQLIDAGVSAIDIDPRCTVADEKLFSHRRGAPTGRLASLVWMQ